MQLLAFVPLVRVILYREFVNVACLSFPDAHALIFLLLLGLTASLGIGRHVTHLLRGLLPEPEPLDSIQRTPLPSVRELVADYHRRGDEHVVIQEKAYRVTHPITKLGWEARSGIAS